MIKKEVFSDVAHQDAYIKELAEENELLLGQLHVVQEALEKYSHQIEGDAQNKDFAGDGTVSVVSPWVFKALVENQKLRALVEQQKIALRVEVENSLPSRLGDMLIKGVNSTGNFLSLPGKVFKMRKAMGRTVPPAELGGKTFQKVIDAYSSSGLKAVGELLDSVFLSPAMRANAYTSLARHLMSFDVKEAAEIARLAWENDPLPYRLKWLAFRMHDADDVVAAEAMLDMLPSDISISESEQRQVMRIRFESAQRRERYVEENTGIKNLESVENHIIAKLSKQNEAQRAELDALKATQIELQVRADERKAEVGRLNMQISETRKFCREEIKLMFEKQKTDLERVLRL